MKTFNDLDERDMNLFSEWFTTEDVPPMTLDEAVDLWWTEIRWFDYQWQGE